MLDFDISHASNNEMEWCGGVGAEERDLTHYPSTTVGNGHRLRHWPAEYTCERVLYRTNTKVQMLCDLTG